jgi:hypothetical protein
VRGYLGGGAMTIADACAILNERAPVKPKHAARTCSECGSDDIIWVEEYRGPYLDPNGTGYDIEVCAECDAPTGARVWVGH